MVLTKNFALPRPASHAPACIGISSFYVPASVAVPPSSLCVKNSLQYLGTAPVTTALAPAALPESTVVAVRPLIIPASEEEAVPYPASPWSESISAYLGPASAPTAPALAPAHLDSYLLLAVTMATAYSI